MSRNGQEKLFEGWLTKSPPIKRIWRGRWRRRWFSLQQSRDLPGQYVLMYYADRNCRKLKGCIDLDHCEQVDTGFKFEDKKIMFDFMFDIKTPSRTYYLAAETDQEMRTWVKYICSVCGLKATTDDEEASTLQNVDPKTNELSNEVPLTAMISTNDLLQSPPVSPVSTSPYIPISECISGSYPLISMQGIKDYQALLQHNLRNSYFRSSNFANQTYESAHVPTYLNSSQFSRSYDTPRLLLTLERGKTKHEDVNYQNLEKLNSSPLQSPTDSESVFTDDDWSHNTTAQSDKSKLTLRQSESSADTDISLPGKFIKLSTEVGAVLPEHLTAAPPRPPKPSQLSHTNLNLSQPGSSSVFAKENSKGEQKNSILSEDGSISNVGILDDMYDFPRSHEVDLVKNLKRHCYNNAAPVSLDGQIFRYDISPRPSTSGIQYFKCDDENLEEPASPLSHSSSTHAYSNLPSPLLPDIQLMPPPIVNRCLKPKRKLSDSLSTSSNPEQSPRPAPIVDRHLKPVSVPRVKQRSFDSEDETASEIHISHLHHRSFDSVLYENDETFDSVNRQKLEYLDLDLDTGSTPVTKPASIQPPRSPGANTVYKEVDFMKTIAFNITRNNLEKEKERKEEQERKEKEELERKEREKKDKEKREEKERKDALLKK